MHRLCLRWETDPRTFVASERRAIPGRLAVSERTGTRSLVLPRQWGLPRSKNAASQGTRSPPCAKLPPARTPYIPYNNVTVTQEQADQLIAATRTKIRAATENVLALEDTPAMKRIEGEGNAPPAHLSGATAARVTPALAALHDLFAQISTLADLVERAAALRKNLNRLWRYDEHLREIEKLLAGASIPLPETSTPLAQRNLLSAARDQRFITPAQLLGVMMDAFGVARDAVLAVDAAWNRLEPALDAALTKAQAIRAEAESLSLSLPAELAQADAQIATLSARVASDPLGTADGFDRALAPLLTAAKASLDAARRERGTALSALVAAQKRLETLRQANADAGAAYAACRAAFADADAVPPPVPDARLAELAAWLAPLEDALRTGRYKAVAVGLERWNEAATATETTVHVTKDKAQSLLALPAELRGRLAIAKSRARAGGTADETLARLALQAETLLQEPRVPIERARKLVEVCEARARPQTGKI